MVRAALKLELDWLGNIPGLTYLAPTNKEEYIAMLDWSLSSGRALLLSCLTESIRRQGWEPKTSLEEIYRVDIERLGGPSAKQEKKGVL